ncbi:MAG: hypothetical protein BWK73_44275 [Thiothrix lacustris]|uniref:Uncharacterized protein n=1 Tax=Thiothrix lacustris TaxID=525917 RepID=A0A1Y1QBA1_9GAMM|nr:MAG: hypothetical protein BWK73_44275 [Thiothrix lacustris]
MTLTGYWYAPESAARQTAVLQLQGEHFALMDNNDAPLVSGATAALQFSQRVGNIPRKITLADGSVFETADNATVDTWLAASTHRAAGVTWMHTVESHWRWIGLALLTSVILLVVTTVWGLPWASKAVAYRLPVKANQALAEGTLQALDSVALEPSKLPKERQQAIREHVQQVLLPLNAEGFTYTVHFRKMGDMANAFALPSGDIIVTDRLAEVVTKPEEFDSILLHEIGHVVNRHGMRQVIQSSAVTLGLVMIGGDASALQDWTAALPGVLLQSQYSRDFETEADRYAFERMMALQIDPAHFGRALQRITADAVKDSPLSKKDAARAETLLKYLSSHPPSAERAALSKQYSQRFQAQHPKE